MKELVQCGFLDSNGDVCPILCDAETGSLHYHDTSTGTIHEIVGLEVDLPHRVTMSDADELRDQVQGLFPDLIGFIWEERPNRLYALISPASGNTRALYFQVGDGAPKVLNSVEVNLCADGDISGDEGYGDVPFRYLATVMPEASESVLRTYLYRTLVLRGAAPVDAQRVSGWNGENVRTGTAALAGQLANPRVVVEAALRCTLPISCCNTYQELVKESALYRLAGCS